MTNLTISNEFLALVRPKIGLQRRTKKSKRCIAKNNLSDRVLRGIGCSPVRHRILNSLLERNKDPQHKDSRAGNHTI